MNEGWPAQLFLRGDSFGGFDSDMADIAEHFPALQKRMNKAVPDALDEVPERVTMRDHDRWRVMLFMQCVEKRPVIRRNGNFVYALAVFFYLALGAQHQPRARTIEMRKRAGVDFDLGCVTGGKSAQRLVELGSLAGGPVAVQNQAQYPAAPLSTEPGTRFCMLRMAHQNNCPFPRPCLWTL